MIKDSVEHEKISNFLKKEKNNWLCLDTDGNFEKQPEYSFILVSLLNEYFNFGHVEVLTVSDTLDQIKGTIEKFNSIDEQKYELSFCIEKIFHTGVEKQIVALDFEMIIESGFEFSNVKLKATTLMDFFLNNTESSEIEKIKKIFDFLEKYCGKPKSSKF